METCNKCGETKPIAEMDPPAREGGNYTRCRECRRAYQREYQKKSEGYKVRHRRAVLKHRYGITPEEYDEMLEAQGGGCGICGGKEPGGRGEFFSVDHDHTCCSGPRACGNCNRGLLCLRCNNSLGWFDTHVDEIASYLQR